MENKVNNLLAEAAERVAERANANKGYEYEGLWMSVNFATARAGHLKKISLRAFGLFIVIRTFMNRNKIAYPKLETLNDLTGLSVNTLRKDIDVLVEHGWITTTTNRNEKGKFDVTKYLILQTDLIRGTGDPHFRRKPVARIDNGNQPSPLSKDRNG